MEVRIQIFARAPVAGEVKTRLIPRIGAQAAAQLQERMLQHAVSIALAANIGPIELWCAPDVLHPAFAAIAEQSVSLHRQVEGNIGERMHHALNNANSGCAGSVLIGCDCPALTAADLTTAAQALQSGSDAVFVPAEDGGYVLIGVHRCPEQLFDGIAWGTDKVMEQTRLRLRRLGWHWKELTPRWDIDRPEDYARLQLVFPHLAVADA